MALIDAGIALLSAVVGEGQGQLSYSYDFRVSSSTCLRQKGMGEHLFHPYSCSMGTRLCVSAPTLLTVSALLPRQGAGSDFLTVATGKGKGQRDARCPSVLYAPP